MKKPALIETTVRLFPNKELVTATTRTTVKSRITDPLLYCPFNGREYLFKRISNKDINPYRSGIETREKASEAV